MKAINRSATEERIENWEMSASRTLTSSTVLTNRVTQILNGRRSIAGNTPLDAGAFFGTSAEFWLNLQSLSMKSDWRSRRDGSAIKALPTIKDMQLDNVRSDAP